MVYSHKLIFSEYKVVCSCISKQQCHQYVGRLYSLRGLNRVKPKSLFCNECFKRKKLKEVFISNQIIYLLFIKTI